MSSESSPSIEGGGQTAVRQVRLTVPLFFATFDAVGRINITDSVVLAQLDRAEQQRILNYWKKVEGLAITAAPQWRLEVHGVAVPDDIYQAVKPAGALVRRLMALLACTVREAPYWPNVLLDEQRNGKWVRWTWAWAGGGDAESHSRIPDDRIATWANLAANWQPGGERDAVEIALDYYYESVIDRPTDVRKAMVSAAIAYEILLGHDIRAEQRFRLSQRGSVLTARGSDGHLVQRELRRIYDARSALLHGGSEPERVTVTKMQQFLMRALPSLAKLSSAARSYEAAIGLLDEAPYGRSPLLEALFDDPTGWWAFVDVPACLCS